MDKQTFSLANILIIVALVFSGMHSSYAKDNLIDLKQLPSSSHKSLTTNTKKPYIAPKPPRINAKAYILIDVDSGKVLAEKNSTQRRAPASLTKMMTMYVVSDALNSGRMNIDDKVKISNKAWKTGGSRMFVKVGESVPIHELLKGIIVQSGNDACVALAEHVAGSENAFADLMNQAAKMLGMKNSHFTDSTGMPHANHYTTARDMAILGRALVKNYPQYYQWYSQKWFTHNGIRQPNRNRLLWRDPSVDGIKTGHTKEAGYCLVSSAKRDKMRLLAVVMGAPSDEARAEDSQALINFGFRFYETHTLYNAAQTLESPRVWLGAKSTVPIGLTEPLIVTIPRGQYKNLEAVLELEKRIKAPVQKGQVLGELELKLNDKIFLTRPLVALENDAKGGIWTRMKDSVRLSLYSWFGVESDS